MSNVFSLSKFVPIQKLIQWIQNERWFLDKDSQILNISCEDYYVQDDCVYAFLLIELKNAEGNLYTRRYFVPFILNKELGCTEIRCEYQKLLIKNYQQLKILETNMGGKIYFLLKNNELHNIKVEDLDTKPLEVSTSNLLTLIENNEFSLISKTYKDMRGTINDQQKIWPSNLEAQSYEILNASNYNNIPGVYGICYYQSPEGEKMAISLLIDFIPNEGEIGDVFWNMLNLRLEQAPINRDTLLNCFESLCKKLAKSVASMHIAFSQSSIEGYNLVPLTSKDVENIEYTAKTSIVRSLNTLKSKNIFENSEVLNTLIKDIEKAFQDIKSKDFLKILNKILAGSMKQQIHGDMSTAQAIVYSPTSEKLSDLLIANLNTHSHKSIETVISKIAQNIRWVDFEGEPAKEMVNINFDSRQNPLKDLASTIEGFWYMLNVKIFIHLGFNSQNTLAHKDSVRKVSLVLSGNMSVSDANIKGLTQELVDFVNAYFIKIKDSLVNGYLAEIEKNNKQNIICKSWSRTNCIRIIDCFIMLRAIHEFGYETYSRDWGWEAISGSMIINLSKKILKISNSIEFITNRLEEFDFNFSLNDTFVSPVYSGILQQGLFIPLHHDLSSTTNPYDDRYNWGIGDFASAKEGFDLAASLGFNIRKMLPVSWSAAFHSPYSVISHETFDPEYIGIPALLNLLKNENIDISEAQKFITENYQQIKSFKSSKHIDHEGITCLKLSVMRILWYTIQGYKDTNFYKNSATYSSSMDLELRDDLLYYILKEENMKVNTDIGWDWRTWSKPFPLISACDDSYLCEARSLYAEEIEFLVFVQFVLNIQWDDMVAYAKNKKVELMMDLPFAPADSRVWQDPAIVVTSGKDNGFKRTELQGVPGKKETPLGQIWQFPVYNFSGENATKYFHNVFKTFISRAKYVRLDHTLGYYQIFVFNQDVNEVFTLKSLKIYEKVISARNIALKEGTELAKRRAAALVCTIIRNSLVYPEQGAPELATNIKDLLFENGDIRQNGANMLIVARAVSSPNVSASKFWHRENQVEDKVMGKQSLWDFLRITPNKRADDEGFAYYWLFPEDASPGPLPSDGIRAGYYRMSPGESILTDFEMSCQKAGALPGHELLGHVPEELEISIQENVGGMILSPKIWGLSKKSRYHPKNDLANVISMFGVADSASIASAWNEFGQKESLLADFKIKYNKRKKSLTPEIHEKLLLLTMNPKAIYPELKEENIPLIAILGLIDLAGLSNRYRLNWPGNSSSWYVKLPDYAQTGRLLRAATGKFTNQKALAIVNIAKRLVKSRNEMARKVTDEVELLGIRPIQNMQIRRLAGNKAEPFIIDAYLLGKPHRVSFCVMDNDDNIVYELDMKKNENDYGTENANVIHNYRIMLLSTTRGIFRYRIKIVIDDKIIHSESKLLAAVNADDDLNPLSSSYFLN